MTAGATFTSRTAMAELAAAIQQVGSQRGGTKPCWPPSCFQDAHSAELQKKCCDDRQKLGEETMKLYREEGAKSDRILPAAASA
ncbi:hypothetical protein [Microlunatus speluncae]|uniref:hypothetical protein n=1 Tax=Microlunatus speluncae TaxID=2594267 RepID=UPI00126668B3|nr:hypothetical protein [Microlunatus speluncae]